MRNTKLSRRSFLAALGLGTAAALLSGCAGPDSAISSGGEGPASSSSGEAEAEPFLSPEEFPGVDGSTACIPLIAQMMADTTGIPLETAQTAVTVSTTAYAWQNLAVYDDPSVQMLLVYEAPDYVQDAVAASGVAIEQKTAFVPLFPRETKGPWELLEGYEIGWAFGPTNPGNAMYTGARLFDGVVSNEWIPFINGNDQNVFPMVFVADMGQPHIFTNFLIADSYNFQGSYRDYEIYISNAYDGANTAWTKVASGMRDYTYCVEANTSPYVKDHPDLTYDYPIQQVAMGRYLKFVILKCEATRDNGIAPSPCGGGKLGDVWGEAL